VIASTAKVSNAAGATFLSRCAGTEALVDAVRLPMAHCGCCDHVPALETYLTPGMLSQTDAHRDATKPLLLFQLWSGLCQNGSQRRHVSPALAQRVWWLEGYLPKSLILLARRTRFEPLAPRFEVCTKCLILRMSVPNIKYEVRWSAGMLRAQVSDLTQPLTTIVH